LRTSALLVAKRIEFFIIYNVSARTKGAIFRDFVRTYVLYGRFIFLLFFADQTMKTIKTDEVLVLQPVVSKARVLVFYTLIWLTIEVSLCRGSTIVETTKHQSSVNFDRGFIVCSLFSFH